MIYKCNSAIRIALFSIASFALLSCDSIEHAYNDPHPGSSSGGSLLKKKQGEKVEHPDLVKILDPAGVTQKNYTAKGIGPAWESLSMSDRFDLALEQYQATESLYDSERRARRDRVQERLLWASVRACDEFKRIMYDRSTNYNFWLGAGSTVTGVLGSVFTPVSTVRSLSAASGILSGVRAEANDIYFQNLATQVITSGIDTKRADLYDRIVKEGRSKSTTVYPVQAAIKDAITYHSACHMITGFEVAQKAIERIDDPGLSQATRTMKRVGTLIAIQNAGGDVDKLAKINPDTVLNGLPVVGTPERKADPNDPLELVNQPVEFARRGADQIRETFSHFSATVAELAKDTTQVPTSEQPKFDKLATTTGGFGDTYQPFTDKANTQFSNHVEKIQQTQKDQLDKPENRKVLDAKLKSQLGHSRFLTTGMTVFLDDQKGKLAKSLNALQDEVAAAKKDIGKIQAALKKATDAVNDVAKKMQDTI